VESRRRPTLLGDELGVLAVIVSANTAHRVLAPRRRIGSNLAAAGTAVGLARRGGVEWAAMGLAPRRALWSGLAWGAVASATAVAAVAALAASPPTRRWFADDRVGRLDRSATVFELGVRIPLETALGEELMFRGALLGTGLRRRPPVAAAIVSSAAFGVWHVLPTLDGLERSSPASHGGDRPSARAGAVAGAVAATTGAGLVLAWLRLRSGSIVAPTLAHAALNASAFTAARLASSRAPSRGAPHDHVA